MTTTYPRACHKSQQIFGFEALGLVALRTTTGRSFNQRGSSSGGYGSQCNAHNILAMCIVYAYYAVESSLERWPLQAVFCGSTEVKEGRYCGMRSCNIRWRDWKTRCIPEDLWRIRTNTATFGACTEGHFHFSLLSSVPLLF